MYSNYYENYNNYLVHFGTKRHSGRYPYGSGERPFQSEVGKKRGLFSFRKRKEEKAPKLPDPSTPEYEKAKRKALKTGTATEVLQFKGSLTQKEMQDAVNRINLERQLSSISTQERDEAWNAMNRAMKKVGDAKNWAKTGIEIYNMIDELSTKAAKKAQSSGSKK